MIDLRWLLVAAQTSLTCVALGLTGEVTRVALAVPMAAVLGAWLQSRGRAPGRPLRFLLLTGVGVAFAYFVMVALRAGLLQGAVALTVAVQAYYLVLPRHERRLWSLQALSFAQFVALAAATTKILFVLVLLGYMGLAPLALTLGVLERVAGGDSRQSVLSGPLVRASLVASAWALLLGTVGFLLLPRYEAGLFRQASGDFNRLSGFSNRVTLGEISRIKQSERVVMRVRVGGAGGGGALRWRGLALDAFDGRTWSLSRTRARTVKGPGTMQVGEKLTGGNELEQEFLLEPNGTHAVFHAANPVTIRSEHLDNLEQDAWGNLQRWFTTRRRTRYEVVSRVGPDARIAQFDPELLELCRELPPTDPRVLELAQSVTRGAEGDAQRASLIESYLEGAHQYSLVIDDVGQQEPVSAFLLQKRAGHCEYFASGMAVMLRSLGVPARIVNGFQEGSWSRFTKAFVVRERDAHSWVEAWIPERGWVAYDPTPASAASPPLSGFSGLADVWRVAEIFWDDHVVGFSFNHQFTAIATLGDLGRAIAQRWDALRARAGQGIAAVASVAAMGVAAGGALAAWRLIRRRRRRASIAFYDRALRLLERRGHRRRPGQTPGELVDEAQDLPAEAARAASELTRLYYAARFGDRPADARRVQDLLSILASAPRPR